MGNWFAYVMIITWPLFAIYLYRSRNIRIATLWTILGGLMFLPVKTEVDLPMLPALGKDSIPVLSAMFGCIFIAKRPIKYFDNRGLMRILVFLVFIIPFMTVMNNGDSIQVGTTYLPGLTYHDAFSILVNQLLIITPFFIGRQFFRTYDDQVLMFKTLVTAGLVYSLFMLFEVRMSPQLHVWLYGYFPHSFLQQYRMGGFRPVVFIGHGLLVAFFAAVILLAATALSKNGEKIRNISTAKISYYFIVVLVLCKSIAALVYGIFAFLIIKSLNSKMQLRIALVIVVLAMLYPTMSIMKLFPHNGLTNIARSYDDNRAQSLVFRFKNEAILLEHAREKFWSGWGGWGRNRVYNSETGSDETVTDGRWIITFGQFGFLGFIAEFGLLAISVMRAYVAAKLVKSKKELTLLSAHALAVGLIMIDQLPNASLAPWLWLIAGILMGRSE
jgi:hypothetical protein